MLQKLLRRRSGSGGQSPEEKERLAAAVDRYLSAASQSQAKTCPEMTMNKTVLHLAKKL